MGRVYAILGDIHANIDALNVVLDDARSQGVTNFVSVGDVVGYNAAPAECIRVVRELNKSSSGGLCQRPRHADFDIARQIAAAGIDAIPHVDCPGRTLPRKGRRNNRTGRRTKHYA